MPAATDIADPDDVPHVQVARLIFARAVYSHDKHLRRPRLAPSTRRDYDQRIRHLSVLSGRRESERGLALAVGVAGTGATAAVSWASVRLGLKPVLVWSALVLASVAGAYRMVASPERRQRISERLEPAMQRAAEAAKRSDFARRELSSAHLVTSDDTHRLEARIATYLARQPDANMGAIAEALDLGRAERRQLSSLLRSHPAFELTSRYGWAVGRIRSELETQPRAHGSRASNETPYEDT